jgi:hypothetical protein
MDANLAQSTFPAYSQEAPPDESGTPVEYAWTVETLPARGLPAVFMVRIWFEGDTGDSQRGYVEHLASGSRRYFRVIDEAADFIAVLSAPPTQSSAASRPEDGRSR